SGRYHTTADADTEGPHHRASEKEIGSPRIPARLHERGGRRQHQCQPRCATRIRHPAFHEPCRLFHRLAGRLCGRGRGHGSPHPAVCRICLTATRCVVAALLVTCICIHSV